MLKKLLLSGAAFAALATYATAQTADPATPATPPAATDSAAPASPGMAVDPAAKADPNLYTNIKGADVVGMNDESLGSVADVLIDSSGAVKSLVIGHGGLVGIGRTYRSYEVSELPAVADGKLALGQMDTAALETLPEYNYPEAETGRAATGDAPADGTASQSAPADSTTLSTTGGGAAAAAGGELWPASYIVGANIGTEDEKKSISDIRFSGNKAEAVLIDQGSLGLGNKVQEVAFEELSISGSPAEPQISMASGGGASAPSSMPDATAPAGGEPSAAPSEPANPSAPADSSAPAPAPAQ